MARKKKVEEENSAKPMYCRHHLLELMYYVDDNGVKHEIRNSVYKLIELGIYYDYKMCITITQSEHAKLHHTGNKYNLGRKLSNEQKLKCRHCGEQNGMYGKHHSVESKSLMSKNRSGIPSYIRTEGTIEKIKKANSKRFENPEWKTKFSKSGGDTMKGIAEIYKRTKSQHNLSWKEFQKVWRKYV